MVCSLISSVQILLCLLEVHGTRILCGLPVKFLFFLVVVQSRSSPYTVTQNTQSDTSILQDFCQQVFFGEKMVSE